MDERAPIRIEALVERAAASWPEHPALICGERRWTYAGLRDEVARRAAVLRAAGLPPGASVCTTEPNSDDSLIAFLAAVRAKHPFLHLSPRFTAAEMRPLLARARTKLLLTADGQPHPHAPEVAALPIGLPGSALSVVPDEEEDGPGAGDVNAVAALVQSSGTTGGPPKLVLTPHRLLTWRHGLPLWWEDGSHTTFNATMTQLGVRGFCDALAHRATFVQASTTDLRRLEAEMVRHGATILRIVPALLHGLVAQTSPPPPGLRLAFVRTGAAALAPELAERTRRRYGAGILQEYSSSEGGGLMGTPAGLVPPESVGKPFAGVEVRLVAEAGGDVPDGEVGELVVRSPGLSLGYLDDPAMSARALRDGWLWTGDLARRDAAGFYYLLGRRSLRLNVGGHMVSPEEVEAVLARHPAVREVVVLGGVDRRRGELVRAVIVPEGSPPSVGELQRFCRQFLAGFKVPRRWEFRDELPRSALGKVLRQRL